MLTTPIASLALLAVLSHVHASAPPRPQPRPCEAATRRAPSSVDVIRELRPHVEQLIAHSATFRAQCRRVAAAGAVVRIRMNPGLDPHRMRARSIISRHTGGLIVVRVELSPSGNPAEWLAHEFEHIVEQLEGVPLRALADRGVEVWRVGENLYETSRAVSAGSRAREELRRESHVGRDKNVE